MAKLLFPLGLVTALFGIYFRTVSGLSLNDLFIVQSGATDGGCDNYFDQASESGILDDWHDEITYALATAIDRIDTYNQDIKVRRALKIFFDIPSQGRASGARLDDIEKIASTC